MSLSVTARHGPAVQRYLQQTNAATCPEIAAATGIAEGDVYTTVASLITRYQAPIRPCGMRNKAALYGYIPGTARRAIITVTPQETAA